MSAIAMILAAGMVVGNGPEKASGEVVQEFKLCGWWEGVIKDSTGRINPVVFDDGTDYGPRGYPGFTDKMGGAYRFEVKDVGGGKLRVEFVGLLYFGIYRYEANRLIICIRNAQEGAPTSFRAGDGQALIILHHINPPKKRGIHK